METHKSGAESPSRRLAVDLSRRYLVEKLEQGLYLGLVAESIIRKVEVNLGSVLFALKYIDRYLGVVEKLNSDSLNGLEIVVCSFIAANKFLEDSYYSNKFWSRILRIDLQEINDAEHKFLSSISFSLHVSIEEFSGWYIFLMDSRQDRRHRFLVRGQINPIQRRCRKACLGQCRHCQSRARLPMCEKRLRTQPLCSAQQPSNAYFDVLQNQYPASARRPEVEPVYVINTMS